MYNRHTKPTHWLVCYVCVLVSQSCLTLCNPMYCSLPGKNTRVDYHFLLHGIFPTQGLNTSLLHCRQILYHLSHQGSLTSMLECYKCYGRKKNLDQGQEIQEAGAPLRREGRKDFILIFELRYALTQPHQRMRWLDSITNSIA